LVTFTNPADQRTLMGWISADSFTAPVPVAAKPPLTCTAPQAPLNTGEISLCGTVCTADTQCPSGQACKGAANKFDNAKLGAPVTFCVAFTPNPTTAATTTAPIAATVNRSPVALVNPPLPIPASNVGVLGAVNGRCPTGFLLEKDAQCHRSGCKINTCPATAHFCVLCNGTPVCSASADTCK
jgi:hypothetical protein